MAVTIPNNTLRYLSVPYTGDALTDITVMSWCLLTGATPANYRVLVAVEPNIVLSTGVDGVSFDAGTATTDWLGQAVPVSLWHHWAATYRNNTTTDRIIQGFLNGKQQVQAQDTSTFSTYTQITVGNDSTGPYNDQLNGALQDLRIWSRALSPQEVISEMLSPVPNEKGLLLWVPFVSDLYRDRSGNNRNLTTTGAGIALRAGRNRPAFPGRGTNFIR